MVSRVKLKGESMIMKVNIEFDLRNLNAYKDIRMHEATEYILEHYLDEKKREIEGLQKS
jgi:hypothetical protein